jgi:hypothetical protein
MNPDQADTTEMNATPPQFPDGIGDACDRRPTQADDKLARFFPFASAQEADAFTGTGFTISADQAHGTTGRWTVKRGEQGDGLSLQLHVARLAFTSTPASLEVAIDGGGVTSGFVCTIVHDTADTLVLREISGATTSVPVGPIAPTSHLVLTLSRAFSQNQTGKAACFLSIDGGSERRIDITTTDDAPIGTYAIAADAADVDINSAVVFTTPFACDTPLTGPLACP